MSIFKRIRQIISANINHAIEKAEDPEKMIKQLIREMDENIISLRLEVARAIASEKRLARHVVEVEKNSRELQEKAEKSVQNGNDGTARKALAAKIRIDKELAALSDQHEKSLLISNNMKAELKKLEDKIQDARRKKEILIARKRSAEARKKMTETTRRINSSSSMTDYILGRNEIEDGVCLDSLEDEILDMETEAEALHELMKIKPDLREELDKELEEAEVDELLSELKKKAGKEK
jgi:phage shock protein A